MGKPGCSLVSLLQTAAVQRLEKHVSGLSIEGIEVSVRDSRSFSMYISSFIVYTVLKYFDSECGAKLAKCAIVFSLEGGSRDISRLYATFIV